MRPFNSQAVPKPPRPDFLDDIDWSIPTDLELGSGAGLFAIRYSQMHPERQLIAIERTSEKFLKMKGRALNHGSPANLFIDQSDVVNWVTHFTPTSSIENYFIWYPNPYPKPQQKYKRYHNMPFTELQMDRLKTGGHLYLATNQTSYFEEALLVYEKVWGLSVVEHKTVDPLKQKPRTHFEKKYLQRGEPCFEACFKKV